MGRQLGQLQPASLLRRLAALSYDGGDCRVRKQRTRGMKRLAKNIGERLIRDNHTELRSEWLEFFFAQT